MASQPSAKLSSIPESQTGPVGQPASAVPAIVRTAPDDQSSRPQPDAASQPTAAVNASGYPAGLGPKVWQIVLLILPTLLTAWLTFVFSRSEARVTNQLDLEKQIFAQQLQLREDLYKREFDTYDKLYAQLLLLRDGLDRLQAGNAPAFWKPRLADLLAELDNLRKTNRLHISKPVYTAMGDAWMRGSRLNGAGFDQDLEQVEALMDSELRSMMEIGATQEGPANQSRNLLASQAGSGGAQ